MTSIAVLLSTYNGARYLEQQLDSILGQKDVHCDLYIRDDGSTDSTVNILLKYQRIHSNIYIFEGENVGPCHSYFTLIQRFSRIDDYNFYCFADQDDVWYPNKLSTSLEGLKAHQSELFCCSFDVTDNQLNIIRSKFLKKSYSPRNLLIEGVFPGCTMVFTQPLFKELKVSLANELTWSTSMHDAWLVRLALLKGRIYTGEEPQMAYRQHGGNVLGTSVTLQSKIRKTLRNIKKSKDTWSLIDEAIIFGTVFRDDLEGDPLLTEVLKRILNLDNHLTARMSAIAGNYLYRDGHVKNALFKLMVLFRVYRRHVGHEI